MSIFEHMHMKKINQLLLIDLVFVHYNLLLRCNQSLNKTPDADPIVLKDIDPSLKWIMESRCKTFSNDDLG